MTVPNPLIGKFVYFLAAILFGGVLATGVVGGAFYLPALNSSGTASNTTKTPMIVPFDSFLTATGSATVKVSGGVKYAAFCVPNPLTKLGTNYGSGAGIIAWSFQMGNNPSNASYDVDFVKSCASGTGQSLMNNVNLASGATLTLTGARLPSSWNGADFVKGATTTAVNAATTGRFRGFVMDIFGE